MFRYSIYGLTLASTLSLEGLDPDDDEVDVYIEIDRSKQATSDEYWPIRCESASPDHVHLSWGGVGDLFIQNGNRILIVPCLDTDEDALRLFVLGAGMGVLLHQRGFLVFHASAVLVQEQAIGFIGAKGWGKSTMAAILQNRGHTLISDELLVVEFDNQGRGMVIPGSPQIRLWSDSLDYIGVKEHAATRVRAGVDKFNVNAENIAQEARPFHGLYLLDFGDEHAIQEIINHKAFFELVPHLYVYRFGTDFFQNTNPTRTFRQLSTLLSDILVKRLIRKPDLGELTAIAQVIEHDMLSALPASG